MVGAVTLRKQGPGKLACLEVRKLGPGGALLCSPILIALAGPALTLCSGPLWMTLPALLSCGFWFYLAFLSPSQLLPDQEGTFPHCFLRHVSL